MDAPAHPAPIPAEDRLGALLDAAVDAIVLIDPNGLIRRFNRAAEKVFGYREAEVVGRNVNLLMPSEHSTAHDTYLRRYLESRRARIIGTGREVKARRKNGATFAIELSVGEFLGDSEHGFVGIMRDVSERKLQEAALQERTEELRLIFDNAPTAITITDIDGNIVNTNRVCETLLGWSRQSLSGRRHADLVVEEDRDALRAELLNLRVTGQTVSRQVRYRKSDGAILAALVHAAVARDPVGRPLLMIVEIVDRTALIAATHEAEDLRARLAHVGRLGTLGEMVSGIAHEVNQPLTAIATYASAARRMLVGGQSNPEEIIGVLDKIGLQAERAGQVIRGLRSMTRKQEPARERLNCNVLIDEVLRLLEFELRSVGGRLRTELAPSLPAILGNGVQIQQVVLNLIRNAIEAMAGQTQGDCVTVSSSAPTAAAVQICVRDTGPGLTPEAEERLFEPFHTTKTQGMGLGLSICKSIVSAHGGELHYRNVPGGGAEFTMTLPTVTE